MKLHFLKSPPGNSRVFALLNYSALTLVGLRWTWGCCNKVIAGLGNSCDGNDLLWSLLPGHVILKLNMSIKCSNSDISVVLKWVKEKSNLFCWCRQKLARRMVILFNQKRSLDSGSNLRREFRVCVTQQGLICLQEEKLVCVSCSPSAQELYPLFQ